MIDKNTTTTGQYLNQFIFDFENGDVKEFSFVIKKDENDVGEMIRSNDALNDLLPIVASAYDLSLEAQEILANKIGESHDEPTCKFCGTIIEGI